MSMVKLTMPLLAAAILAGPAMAKKDVKKPAVVEDCKPIVAETGVERTGEGRARQSAVNAWRNKAVAAYGQGYSDWTEAKDKRERCYGTKLRNLVKKCEVSARPCQPVMKSSEAPR